MASEVHVTEAFEYDLHNALAYLEETLGEPGAAERLMYGIDAAQVLLSEQPFLNALSRKPWAWGQNYREHFVLNYVVVYTIKDDGVWFLRLFHQRQSYGRFVVEW